jgi:hypothetical protein
VGARVQIKGKPGLLKQYVAIKDKKKKTQNGNINDVSKSD